MDSKSNTTKAAHTPGAMRAAKAIVIHETGNDNSPSSENYYAWLIDRETAAPEMLEALNRGLKLINEHADELAGFEHPDVINACVDAMRAAIQKARGGQ